MIADAVRRAVLHPNAVSFVKRAVNVQGGPSSGNGENEGDEIELPTWGFALLYVSFVASMVFISLMSYMLNEVITTLCMVETPTAAITISPSVAEPADKEEKEGLLEAGPTITLVHQKPITSSIRGTIKHLVANAGRWSRFRGLRIHALYSFAFVFVAQIFDSVLPHFCGQAVLVAALSGAVVAPVHAAWTHKVVSLPSEQSFWQRIPAKSHWKTLALPAAIKSAMPYISVYIIAGVAMLFGLHNIDQETFDSYDAAQVASLIFRGIATLLIAVSCTLFLCIPAIVTLVRIESSVLPEDQDTIVPFDRTFGGKVVSQHLGGSGKIAFLDAWRSFNWEARRRLIALYVKSFAMVTGMAFVVLHILAFEVFVIMGPALGKLLAQAQHSG
ncbi:hypothetical protein P153DRAFT_338481 [Dothidotthia symphoricarpi CBS 119687]|uniref:Ubiquitin carrier protein n=1 Tax=Dothidotthia symphoricarpi CBS 119687 TaxID=1392245 RepID=A0A6A6AI53_9PLEO|nr:uncharacterized protein P153DRAFT_338481 [Dothidotthia symphoricarpi CBS 119687]KAF2130564.1 hypothetical protein P153DRAFT_338481 [Dothidotthia symphoricarpi CBS 119687]